jgi:hypothetical protein
LVLGLIDGRVVHRWAERVIAQDPTPPSAFFDVVLVAESDLTELRHALWPLVVEPEPPDVLESVLGLIHSDLASGRRTLGDTVTVLRQMRSMLRLPPAMYADLNAALVSDAVKTDRPATVTWLAKFAGRERKPI